MQVKINNNNKQIIIINLKRLPRERLIVLFIAYLSLGVTYYKIYCKLTKSNFPKLTIF